MEYKNYAENLGYPEIIIDKPCMSDVRCLTEDFAGRDSETTAILQYIYQSYIATEVYGKEFGDLFKNIAIVEMHHHEMLASAILKCGGDPMIGGNRQFWNGSYVNYNKDLKTMIQIDILSEKAAILTYKRTIKCLNNFCIKELIERIILDEEKHLLLLNEALERVNCKN